jgi:hypothetical protein
MKRALAMTAAMAIAASCKTAAAPGEVMVVLRTDVSLPKDIDSVRLQILVRGDTRFDQTFEKLGAAESLEIPASLGVIDGESADPSIPVTFRVSAFQHGSARVLREAVTTIPPTRVVALSLPVHWLCFDEVTVGTNGDVGSSCPEGQTCVAGSCADKTIDSSLLPAFDPSSAFGGGTGKGDGVCLDVVGCFEPVTPVAVDSSDCSFASSEPVNVALLVQSAGECGPHGCFVALDAESDSGWTSKLTPGRITLPKAVCDRIASGLVGAVLTAKPTKACPLKAEGIPACGPWSPVGKPVDHSSAPVALASHQSHPVSLALGGGSVYWTSAGASETPTGAVKRASVDGGEVELVWSGLRHASDLAVVVPKSGIATVYWTENGVPSNPSRVNGRSYAVSPPALLDLSQSLTYTQAEGIAARGTDLFVTDSGLGSVNQVDASNAGKGATQLLAAPSTQPTPFRVVVDTQRAFWTNEVTAGSIVSIDLASKNITSLASMQAKPRGLALALDPAGLATDVVWANYEGGQVRRLDLAMGGAPVDLATGRKGPSGVAVSGGYAYWTERGLVAADAGRVVRAKLDGSGMPELLWEDAAMRPGSIAVDATSVYWIDEGSSTKDDGKVLKLALP